VTLHSAVPETRVPETAWQAGRLDAALAPKKQQPRRILFGQMYEDPRIELAAFEGRRRVFCISSAGSTAFHLAAKRDGTEHDVVACDINPVQLDYARSRVDGAAKVTGDAERAMNFARAFMPLVGWSRKRLDEFFQLSDTTQQMEFWHRHFDTRRFRTAFDTLLSFRLLRAVYSPKFLSFLPTNFGEVMRHRWERGFALHPNSDNPYARALLLGEQIEEPLTAAANVEFVLGDAASYLESCLPGEFEAFTLSNILDGAEPAYRQRLAAAVRHAAAPGAVAVLRSFAEPPAWLTNNHAARDRSLIWGVVELRRADEIESL
jgi:hypothetical protein